MEPFEVDQYPGFSAFLEITVEIQAFSDLHEPLNLSISKLENEPQESRNVRNAEIANRLKFRICR